MAIFARLWRDPGAATAERERAERERAEAETTVDAMTRTWQSPGGLYGILAAVQNNPISNRYLVTAFVFFLVGGILALLMRLQLAVPENTLLTAERYNQFFTMHGTTMMFLFAVPFLEAVAIAILPSVLGNRDFPFPRLTALGYWTYLLGGIFLYSSFLFGAAPDGGWFAYVPLTGPTYSPGLGIDFWLLGLGLVEVAAIGGSIEFIVGILKMRAPGMSLHRMPIYAWAMLVTGLMTVFGFTPLLVGDVLLELDRKLGTQFFDPSAGGDPLLWQHLFWLFGHPEVYIQLVPATGMVSLIVPVFARRPLVGYPLIVLAVVSIGFLSFGLWVHHMFTVGLSLLALGFFGVASASIAIPSGIQFFAWIGTLWTGRPVLKTPLLFIVGFVLIFVAGGITGIMVSSVPFDWQVHDSFFVVAHFHYVLIGGVVFPIFAAIYYWFPKLTGRMLSERLGRWNFWLTFVGFNLAFFPMHISGLLGMPRRVYTYQSGLGWELLNLLSTIGAFILGLGILIFVVNFFWSLRRGEKAGPSPWGGDTLEWSGESPGPNIGFRTIPIVRSRHPLWEQDRLDEGDERTVQIVRGLAERPDTWRAALVTTALDARPQMIQRMGADSIWPFIAAVGLAIASVAEVFDRYLLMGLGVLVAAGGIIAWLWPSVEERRSAESEESATLHGLPLHTTGSAAVGWWAMVFLLGILTTVLASLFYSYFYLRAGATAWPPAGYPEPDLVLPIIGAAVLVASIAPMFLADRGIRRNAQGRLQVGLAASGVLGTVFVALMVWHLLESGFNPASHAYTSIFLTIAAFQIVLVLVGLVMIAVVLIQAWLGYFNRRRYLAVQNTALYWYFVAAASVPVFAVIYGAPYLL